ncbi:MAG: hypothetical protein JNL58_31955 [Planctomyces sp.]|nr:hypothetical protein [Planctomyces sp.]
MTGIPNPPTTITGSTPAWVPMTEAQWTTFTEAQWVALTENTGSVPQQLSARYDAWNRLVLITSGTQKVSEHVYDARGYRIRKDTYTSGTLSEARHYYYTPGWQCVEERVGTSTTAERQFVWGLRYIDDLILRDRSTANNGTMDERRYAIQDGNWNVIAICDTSGTVGERYAYSAYGSTVFMNGSGTVQSSSAVGFETLYAGYRFDGTSPQMYYVRNRFLLPMIGTWNRRDPLGYVDGLTSPSEGLYSATSLRPLILTDPFGLFGDKPKRKEHRIYWGEWCQCNDVVGLIDLGAGASAHLEILNQGCVGVAMLNVGKSDLFDASTDCFEYVKGGSALIDAQNEARRKKCPGGAKPKLFAKHFYSGNHDFLKRRCKKCSWVEYGGSQAQGIGEFPFDYSVYNPISKKWEGANHKYIDNPVPPQSQMEIIEWPDLDTFCGFYSEDFDTCVVCVTCPGGGFGPVPSTPDPIGSWPNLDHIIWSLM